MATLDDLYSRLPLADIAKHLGVDQDVADDAVREALPALVGGLQANAKDPAGATSIQKALGKHSNDLADGRIDLDRVDTADGAKIVKHVFGDKEQQVASALGGSSSKSSEGLIQKLLPILAPIVLSYLASKVLGGGSKAATGGAAAESASGGGIGDVLGGLLGGGSSSGSGGGLGDVLGGLLGGGSSKQSGSSISGGGLGDLLGGLLGGGRR